MAMKMEIDMTEADFKDATHVLCGAADRDVEMPFSSSLQFLETKLDPDTMDRILSFLELPDYSNLSMASSRMRASVSTSSHLVMTSHRRFRLRRGSRCTTPITNKGVNTCSLKQGLSYQPASLPEFSSPQQDLEALLDRFHNLRILSLHGSLAAVGDDLIRILNSCPAAHTLQSITLHGCALSYWCAQSFQLGNLQHLTLTGNSIRARISFLLKDSKSVRTLALKQCPAVRDEDIHEVGRLLQDCLEDLTLSHVKTFRPRAFLPRLARASFVGCFNLSDLSGFLCPNLRQLNISFCVRLTSEQIEGLVGTLLSLDTLIMIKCSDLRTLELSSKTLRVLNASYLHSLERLRLVCPSLEQLEVSVNLERVSSLMLQ
jgi:hypothetical protein